MNWLDRAEARYGHLAIPGLGRILVGFNLLVYVLYKIYPETLQLLALNPALVWQGQVWRLFTFIFIPGFGSPFGELVGILMYLLYINFIAAGLEQAIGAFKLNVFYATGMVAIILSSMFLGGASFALLTLAVRDLPIGTAYAAWTGIGAAGTALVGIVALGESGSAVRLACIALIVVAVVGLQLSSGGHA